MIYIYILLLINNTYLLISSEDRINEIHNIPDYKDIIDIIKCSDKSEVDKIVQKYITEFGNDKVKTSTYNNIITEDDKKIIEYIDNYNNSEIIEKEIQKLTMLKQKILHLKNIIQSTKLEKIKEYGFGKFISDYSNKTGLYSKFIIEISESYIKYIRYEISKNQLPENFIYDNDVILQLYSTMYFNKKMKQHLTNFINKNGTEEQITTKLTYAYSKLFSL